MHSLTVSIETIDIGKVYKELLEIFQPKTTASRTPVLQELIAPHKGFEGFEMVSYQEYSVHAMALASHLVSAIPEGSKYTPEIYPQGIHIATFSQKKVEFGATATVKSLEPIQDTVIPSTYLAGYQARQLIQDLAASMIPIGLPPDNEALCHTLNHVDLGTGTNMVLEHLCKSDSLACSTRPQGTSATAALAAVTAKKEKQKKPLKNC
jgi:hypothetical protein